jgi:putative DNA primase/helicase
VDVMRVIRPALLIIDPIVSAVAGDSHKNAETRRALQPLVDMAVKLDVALLGITHFSKGTAGRDPTERVTGSLAFGAIARVVMVAVKCKKEGGGGPILCRSKSNIGPDGDGFTYELEQQSVSDVSGIIASCISWREAVYGTATELLADAETADKDGGLLAEAKEFLEAELADGPVAASAMTAAVKQAAHSAATIRRAKKELGIISKKVGIKGGWCWVISPKVLKIPEDAHHNNLSAFDDNEHVQDNGVKAWKAEI